MMSFARLAWLLCLFCSAALVLLALHGQALMSPPSNDLFAPRQLGNSGDLEFFQKRNLIQLEVGQEMPLQDLLNMYQLQEHNRAEIERQTVEREGQKVVPAGTSLELRLTPPRQRQGR